MVHYYYIDHAKQQSSADSESSERGNNQAASFSCSGEILQGNFFLFGQAVWIVCQLLGKNEFLYFRSLIEERFSFKFFIS